MDFGAPVNWEVYCAGNPCLNLIAILNGKFPLEINSRHAF